MNLRVPNWNTMDESRSFPDNSLVSDQKKFKGMEATRATRGRKETPKNLSARVRSKAIEKRKRKGLSVEQL